MPMLLNPVGSRTLILDVGANQGTDGLRLAQANPQLHVIGFEPTPQLVRLITQKVQQAGLKNYTLVDAAAGAFDGRATFNIAGQGDWGCSSLNSFSEGLDKTWPGRTDFKVTERIEVQVLRLDSFLAELDFESIAYLHCDTQGSDLDVLRGMGRFREQLQRGVIECASARPVALYREQHLLEDACFEFARWGFEIERVEPNDPQCNEINLHFRNKFVRPRVVAPGLPLAA
jgi:FkbM family methyltransferase